MTEATPTGAPADQADAFQQFYDRGAFSEDGAIPADAQTKPEAQTPQAEADADAEEPDKAQTPAAETVEAEPEAPQYADLDDFLGKNELKPEEFHDLGVKVKIDGETRTIPLKDVIKSFQLEGHVNNKSMELANAKRAFETEQQTIRQTLQQQLERNETLGNLAMQSLNADYQRVDWNRLRAEDPAQYAATFADFQQRQQNIQNYLGQINAQKQQEAQNQQVALGEQLKLEQQRLLDARPEWRDQAVFKKDSDQMKSVAKKYGFTDAELSSVIDHRYLLLLDRAARYEALQAAKPAATKLVREAPKMAKPGTRTNRDPKQAAKQSALESWRQNPRDDRAAAAYFEEIA